VFVIAPSILTGVSVSGASRFNVTSRSPLGGTIGDAQCGGDFGPELKYSGYDAIVVTGKSDKPVYLWLHNGEAEIRDASGIWGKTTGDTRKAIRAELGDEKVQIACIGPGGEKLVRFANVSGDGSHYAGRTGTGAVMGSKNLKAVACRGKRAYEYADPEAIKAIAKKAGAGFKKLRVRADPARDGHSRRRQKSGERRQPLHEKFLDRHLRGHGENIRRIIPRFDHDKIGNLLCLHRELQAHRGRRHAVHC